jgi:feruloyl esterase
VIYPGLVPGGEAGPGGWASYVTGSAPGQGRHANLAVPFFKFMVFDDPNWDYKTFKFTRPTVSTATSTTRTRNSRLCSMR